MVRKKKTQVAGRAKELNWDNATEALGEAMCVVDAEGVVVRSNQAFAKTFTQSIPPRSGVSLSEILIQAGISEWPRVSDAERSPASRTVLGGTRTYRISAAPIDESGAVYLFSDVTAQGGSSNGNGTVNEDLAGRAAALQENVRSLDSFCYTIAHDLKAPLRSMKGFTVILQEDYAAQLDSQGQEYARRIVQSADQMNNLIEDLLEYGRLSHIELPLMTVQLEDEVQSVLMELWADIQAKNAKVDVRKPLPTVLGNTTLVRQIIQNLLSNALKFVAPGVSPQVTISAKRDNDIVRLSVADNGIGIDSCHYERIFQLFERLHTRDSGYGGTGVGLALVRKGAERMGGKVGVESILGRGSVFWLELPASRV